MKMTLFRLIKTNLKFNIRESGLHAMKNMVWYDMKKICKDFN